MLCHELFELVASLGLPCALRHVEYLLRLRLLIRRRHPLRVGLCLLRNSEQRLSRVLCSLIVSVDVLHYVLGVGAAGGDATASTLWALERLIWLAGKEGVLSDFLFLESRVEDLWWDH